MIIFLTMIQLEKSIGMNKMRGEISESFQLFIISICALAVEMVLFRLFAFLVGFHFVSLIISLALLGYGASGTLYRFFPDSIKPLTPFFFIMGLIFILVGFVILPLDVYEFWTYLLYKLNLIVLIIFTFIPFFYHALYQIYLFDKYPERFPRFYSINLIGSAIGVIVGIVLLMVVNEVKSLVCVMGIGCIALLNQKKYFFPLAILTCVLLFIPLTLKISDYSPTRQLKLIPENQLLYTFRNPSQHLEVFSTPFTRAATGLSMRYREVPPSSYSLVYDHIQQQIFPNLPSQEFINHTLFSLPLRAFNPNEVLIIECNWGYEMFATHYADISTTMITSSPLFRDFLETVQPPFSFEGKVAFPRKYLSQVQSQYDMIFLQVPIGNADIFPGTFSMKENYLFTIEGIRSVFEHLNRNGKLVISFFPQTPPMVLVKLLDMMTQVWGGPEQIKNRLVIIKNLDFALLITSKFPLTPNEIHVIGEEVSIYRFDFIYYPGIAEEEAEVIFQNQKANYRAVIDYFQDPFGTLQKSHYQVGAPRDNKPYFSHFFKWEQFHDTFYNLGKRWLPFGGAGFLFVIFILLVITTLSLLFILIPGRILIRKKIQFAGRRGLELAAILTGAGYMLIEIPIIVQLEMIIGFPIYTFAVVLAVLLVFSGLGSRYVEKVQSDRLFHHLIYIHPLVLVGFFLFIHFFRNWLLGIPGIFSLFATLIPFSVVAFLAGTPFPVLSRLAHRRNPEFFQVVFAWNGFMSVIASLLSHLAAIEYGIHFPYFLSIPIYGGFWITVYYLNKSSCPSSLSILPAFPEGEERT